MLDAKGGMRFAFPPYGLYNSFDNLRDAEKLEKQMLEGRRIGDNYFITIVKAENDKEAEVYANGLRPHP